MSNCVSFYFHLNEIDTRMSMHRGCSTLGWPHNRIVMHTITRGEGVRKNSDAQSRSIDHTSLLHFRLRKIELWRKIFPSREEGKIGLFPPSLCLSLYLILFFFFRFIFDLLDHQFTRDFYPLSRFERRKKVFLEWKVWWWYL